jgi:methyltransferase (TIGR00027 family)
LKSETRRRGDEILADYYDSDHPRVLCGATENWDDASVGLGLATDVAFYAGLRPGARVVELGAGTGRVTEGLLAVGCEVHAVEPSEPMRARLEARIAELGAGEAITVHTSLETVPRELDFAVLAFGVLSCVPSRAEQLRLLTQLRSLLREGGLLALDDPEPELLVAPAPAHLTPTWIRTHVERGARYVRSATRSVPSAGGELVIRGSYQEAGLSVASFELRLCVSSAAQKAKLLAEAGFGDLAFARGPDAPTRLGPRAFILATAGEGDGSNATRWWGGDPSGVAQTALSSAAARALDARGASLVGDRYAICLQGETGRQLLADTGGVEMAASIVARTAWFDDQIRAAPRPPAGLLHLGAGLCARALRMKELARVQITEVDHPELLRFKRERLACFPAPGVRALGLDIHDVPRVLSELERLPRPRWVLAEGLLSYLDPAAAEALVEGVARHLGREERVLFDTLAPGLSGNAAVAATLAGRGLPFRCWSPEALLSRLPGVAFRATHLGAPDARAGLPAAPRGGTLLWSVRTA